MSKLADAKSHRITVEKAFVNRKQPLGRHGKKFGMLNSACHTGAKAPPSRDEGRAKRGSEPTGCATQQSHNPACSAAAPLQMEGGHTENRTALEHNAGSLCVRRVDITLC